MAEEKCDVKMQAPDGKMRETDAANLERENLMSNVPKLIFPEFTGEWEEKRLSDIALVFKRKRVTT